MTQQTIPEDLQPDLMLSYLQQGRFDQTLEALALSVDPDSGVDPLPVRMRSQEQIDAHGSFKTLEGAVEALPSDVRHNVTITMADGAYSYASLPNFDRFVFRGYLSTRTKITIQSESTYVRRSGLAALPVAAYSAGALTLDADPGYVANAHRGQFVRVDSGTGVGTVGQVRTHTTTAWVVNDDEFTADATSEVEVVECGAIITLSAHTSLFNAQKQLGSVILFQGIELGGSNELWIGGGAFAFTDCRIAVSECYVRDARAIFNSCVIDNSGTGLDIRNNGFASLTGTLVRGATFGCLPANDGTGASTGYLSVNPQCAFDDCTYGIWALGIGAAVGFNPMAGNDINDNSGTTTFLTLSGGARASCSAAQLANMPTNSGTEISIDGSSTDWATVDGDANNQVAGVHGSQIAPPF